jgi:hypothetical protein
MTSANVIEYRIERDGKEVGHHRVNVMCKDRFEELLKFEPYSEHTITAYGYDEEEEYWEDEPGPLLELLKYQSKYNKEIREKLAAQGIIVQSIQDWWKENKHLIKSRNK